MSVYHSSSKIFPTYCMSVTNYLPQYKVYLDRFLDSLIVIRTPKPAEFPSPSSRSTNSLINRASKLVSSKSFEAIPLENTPQKKMQPNSKSKASTGC